MREFAFFLICALGSLTVVNAQQVPKPPVPKPMVSDSLKKLYRAMQKEDYAAALKHADTVLSKGQPHEQRITSVAYGRILLGLKNTAAGTAYLGSINRTVVANNPNGDPLPAYEAWLKHLQGETDDAVEALESVISEDDYDALAIAESADVLAQIKIAKNELDDAKKAIQFAFKKIKFEDKKTAYIEAILRRRLNQIENADRSPAEKLYRQAEVLRKKDKFSEAMPIYQQIVTDHADTDYCDPSGYRIGQCLIGMDRTNDAITYWTKDFINPSPGEPYRGQAIIAVAEYHLEERLELGDARKILSAAEPFIGPAADNSWMAVKHALCIRLGLVAYLRNEDAATREWFRRAKKFAPERPKVKSLGDLAKPAPDPFEELVRRLDSRETITPDFARKGDEKSALLIVMGDVYLLLDSKKKSVEYFQRVVDHGSGAKPTQSQLAHARYRLMQHHWTKNDGKQCVQLGKQFLQQHPKHPYAADVMLHCAIVFHSMLDDHSMSLSTFENVRKRYPDSKQAKTALWQMATIHRWNKNYPQAAKLYQQYKRQYPDDGGISFIDRALTHMKDPENEPEPLAMPNAKPPKPDKKKQDTRNQDEKNQDEK